MSVTYTQSILGYIEGSRSSRFHKVCTIIHYQICALGINWLSMFSTLDKQRICVNTQLNSSKKQIKWNVCVPKRNYKDRYAITCDVIAYHLVHFVSIWLINKCYSGIDFILLASLQYSSSFMNISVPSPVFRGKTLWWKWNFAKCTCSNIKKGMRFASGTIKSASLIL